MDYIADAAKPRQVQSTAAKAGPKPGRPPAPDEREIALPLWRAAGRDGINKLHFTLGTGPLNGRMISQVSRLVHTLEKEGYVFLHLKGQGELPYSRFTTFVLVAEPMQPRKPAAPAEKKPVAAAGSQMTLLGLEKNGTDSDSRAFLDAERGLLF